MDDKDFKKHLKDLTEGHHHPEEHDWAASGQAAAAKPAQPKSAAKSRRKAPKRPAK